MSIWIKLFKGIGKVTAVYHMSGVTYVEIRPNNKAVWDAIRERCERLGAVADIKS